jgi:hypothetical protein
MALFPGLPAGPRPEPPGAWAASAAFGWRALLKIKHVPEILTASKRYVPTCSNKPATPPPHETPTCGLR